MLGTYVRTACWLFPIFLFFLRSSYGRVLLFSITFFVFDSWGPSHCPFQPSYVRTYHDEQRYCRYETHRDCQGEHRYCRVEHRAVETVRCGTAECHIGTLVQQHFTRMLDVRDFLIFVISFRVVCIFLFFFSFFLILLHNSFPHT